MIKTGKESIKVEEEKIILVSMGILPMLNRQEGELLLKYLAKAKLKKETF